MKSLSFRSSLCPILIIGALSVFIVSCEKQSSFFATSELKVQVGNPQQSSAKSSIIPFGDDMILEEIVTEYTTDQSISKGPIITTDGHYKMKEVDRTFNIEGWLGPESTETNRHFVTDTPIYDGTSWEFQSKHYWVDGIPTTFWSYFVPDGCPQPSFTWPGTTPTADELKTISFSYILPSPTSDGTDAYELNDFVIGYNRETRSVSANGTVTSTYGTGTDNSFNISFNHPLATLRFMVGNINGSSTPGDNEYVEINKIELINVASKGEFTATGSDQNRCTFACTPSIPVTYVQNATRQQLADGQYSDANSDYFFFMIPQTLSDVTLKITMLKRTKTVTYEADGETIKSVSYSEPKTLVREAKLSGSWASGKYYTYKLSPLIYFSGEDLTMDVKNLEKSSDNITVDQNGQMSFHVSGTDVLNEWIAPLPCTGVKVLKLRFTHSYDNNSQASYRQIWLENATLNPDYSVGGTEQKYINPNNIATPNADLVQEAKNAGYSYWKDNYYTGYLGDASKSGKKYIASAYDNDMNNKGSYTNQLSTMYFYLGGKFDYVKIHFDYMGATGSGSVSWTAVLPTFKIVEAVQ